MPLVPLTSIIVGERQRSDIKPADQESLMESILKNGLFHALVVESIFNGHDLDPAQGYSLLAGERRFRAISSLAEFGSPITYNGELIPLGQVPVTFRQDLSEEARQEIELEENIRRVDLSWQDRAAAVSKLHALREKANPTQTIAATQAELASMGTHLNAGDVSRSIIIQRHMDNPKVAGARSLKEAVNVVTRTLEAEVRADLLRATEQTSEHVAIEGDCLEWLKAYSGPPIDVILTDPPYGVSADAFGKQGPSHNYADDLETALSIAAAILHEGFRICKPDAHCYLFCDIEQFPTLKTIAAAAGWKPFRTPLTWYKTASMGHDPWPQRGFRRSTEWILYTVKGDRPYQTFMNDCISVANISSSVHPATKPVELYRKLLERSCLPGDLVLDPCCGLGPIFEAATALHLKAIGIEADPDYAQIASNRRFEKMEEKK